MSKKTSGASKVFTPCRFAPHIFKPTKEQYTAVVNKKLKAEEENKDNPLHGDPTPAPAIINFSEAFLKNPNDPQSTRGRFYLTSAGYSADDDEIDKYFTSILSDPPPQSEQKLTPADILVVIDAVSSYLWFAVHISKLKYVQDKKLLVGLESVPAKKNWAGMFMILHPKMALEFALEHFNPENLSANDFIDSCYANDCANCTVTLPNGSVIPKLPTIFTRRTYAPLNDLINAKKRTPAAPKNLSDNKDWGHDGSVLDFSHESMPYCSPSSSQKVADDDDDEEEAPSSPAIIAGRKRETRDYPPSMPTINKPSSSSAPPSKATKTKADPPPAKDEKPKRQRTTKATASTSDAPQEDVNHAKIRAGVADMLSWDAFKEKFAQAVEKWAHTQAFKEASDFKQRNKHVPEEFDASEGPKYAIQKSLLSDDAPKDLVLNFQQWGMLAAAKSLVDDDIDAAWRKPVDDGWNNPKLDFTAELLHPHAAAMSPEGDAKGDMSIHYLFNLMASSRATLQTLELTKPLLELIQTDVTEALGFILEDFGTVEAKRSEARTENKKLQQELSKLQQEIASLKAAGIALEDKLATSTSDYAKLEQTQFALQTDYDLLFADKAELDSQLKKLQPVKKVRTFEI